MEKANEDDVGFGIESKTRDEEFSRKKRTSSMKHSYSTPDFRIVKKLDVTYSEMPYIYIHNVKDFLKADIPLTKNSYPLCPHKHHCAQNAFFKGFFRTFAAAYIFKTSVVLVTQLFGGKIKSFKKIESIYYSVDSIKFAQFVGLMSFTYKSILCILRRYRHKDPIYHKTIAGFISGLWILWDDPTRRNTLALYCLVRAIGDWIKLISYNVNKTHNKDNKNNNFVDKYISGDVVAFTISQLFIMYAFCHNPKSMDNKYYKWIKHMGNLKEEQIQLVYRSALHQNQMYRTKSEPFPSCNPIFHPNSSCLYDNTIDWIKCIFRAGRMYLPVHFLPMLLFTPKLAFKDPILFVKYKLMNTLRSSIFLATYVFNMKETQCIIRNSLHDDPWWQGVIGGLMAGLSIILEHSKRRTELCLYVIPRAIEILFRLIPKDKGKLFKMLYYFLRWKYLPVIAFCCAISAWMSLMAQKHGIKHANGLNITVLQVIFGTKH